ncbi:ion transporter [Epidermidibacterium keratini]|uniref:Ion transporter n=1 Tax=Epidermidibacterium keratini TaxID=1891644 RepID=A0A7L4YM09_9ACTN|nr:ion transporter [Epidermidibacterium keratini]QHC00108.1 ion transporter [Epidermidibacterium keratini]
MNSRERVGRWVESQPVQRFVLAVIIFNGITIGLETSPWMRQNFGQTLRILDYAAITIFVVEILAKLYAYGWRFFRDGWNVFDFIIIGIALVPASGPFAVLRALRILRLVRLVERLPRLRFVVEALLKSLPGISAIAALMALLFYIAAAMATTLFAAGFPQWFGNIGRSLYTLFQIMTLESWSMGIVRPVMEEHPYAWLFFVPFILASAFTMLNLFIAVIVDTMQNLHKGAESTPEDPESAEEPGSHPEAIATASSQDLLLEEVRALRAQVTALERDR